MPFFSYNKIAAAFSDAYPFPHVVIDGFLDEDRAEALATAFPLPNENAESWFEYRNPIEKKFALKSIPDDFQSLYAEWQSPEFVKRLEELTGLTGLQADPYLHGAGLHAMTRGSKLDMHLDYSLHPTSGKERKLNLILYLGDWDPSWGGELELWDKDFTECKQKITPKHNRALLFQTTDAYHGVPNPISCPEGVFRRTATVFYVIDANENTNPRKKAEFRALPHQPVDEKLQKVYDIRKTRLVTPSDLWEGWETEGNGFW